MRNLKYILPLIVLLNLYQKISAQNFTLEDQHIIDSLNTLINNPETHDTTKVNCYFSIAAYYYLSFPDTAITVCEKAKKISEKINYLRGKSQSYGWLAYLINQKGDIQKALEYYHKSLKILRLIGNKESIATALNNIGSIYGEQGDTLSEMRYYKQSLKIRKEIGDKKGISYNLNNIGFAYHTRGNNKKAMEYYQKSLKIREEIGDKRGIANSFGNIGSQYKSQGAIEKAIEYYQKSLKINEELGDKKGIANALSNLGGIFLDKGELKIAQNNAQRSFKLAQEIGFPAQIESASKLLSEIYEEQGKDKQALEMYKLHIVMRDSINNDEIQRTATRQQTKYEFEKAQIIKEKEEKEEARLKAEIINRRNNLQYSLIFLGVIILFGIVLSLGFIKVSGNVAEGLIFFAFLILFEFVLVFAEPYIGKYTKGEPMYNLLANSVIALLIFPLHNFFEDFLKKKIVKK